MRGIVTFAAIAGLGVLSFSGSPGAAETAPPDAVAGAATDISSQSRARTRIRVQRYYPYRRYHSFYPLPYDIEYPGPNARRDCSVRYVQEYRPSGTVVVPRMNCWWVRG